MEAEGFERIAAAAEREDVRLEFIHGELGVKAVPDGDHDEIIIWVMEHCMQQRPDLRLYSERGLEVETYRTGHARPDGTLAPRHTFSAQGEWASADQVLMVVEVTSYDFDTDTDKRDRDEKPRAYAETGIPVYLLVDRTLGEVVVHSSPESRGVYAHLDRYAFGAEVRVPEPVGVVLDTEPLKGWVR
ncbi:Uma2 family endonuclease [Streptomyces sp. V4-01]|uniref:Uma2 family endonuclease n=2 Tax=Actinacidiphila polyblastidii TaxID=3110430 RepID=A0ABU7P8M9_9ACTN|nr:Uma2 family endonuclease [Streptomyces sp. V4-01]